MRRLVIALVASAAAGLSAGPAARAQTADTVRYYDRSARKEEELKGTVQEEGPARVVVRQGTATKSVPAEDVRDVNYEKSVGGANSADLRKAQRNEDRMQLPGADADARRKAFEEARKAYQDLAGRAKESKAAQRHMRYCAARVLARRSVDDPEQLEPAIAELQKFVAEDGDGWQVGQAVRLLGQLQEAKGDLAGAQKTYDRLAARDDVPKETRQECELQVARMLIRGSRAPEARARLEALARALPPGSAAAPRVQVFLAQCDVAAGQLDGAEGALKRLLAGDLEDAVKGQAYNALGDIARQRKKAEDAFWDYLLVDVVYNQDKYEQAKALYWLSKLFVEVKNDPARAREYRDRLLSDRDFLGLDYQKQAAREKGE